MSAWFEIDHTLAVELCPFNLAGVEGLAPYLRVHKIILIKKIPYFCPPCLLQQCFLLLLIPGVLLRLKLLDMLKLLSLDEVLQANSSNQELGLKKKK